MEDRSLRIGSFVCGYTLIRRNGRRGVRLAVASDGTFTVSAPASYSISSIESMIRAHEAWILKRMHALKIHGIELQPRRNERASYLHYKEAARRMIAKRLPELNERYGFDYKRVSIKNQRRCWGSCSKQGNLNFNYKLVLLPDRLADYVMVHELCHLKEMNHSVRFWKLVGESMPDYRELRHQLKTTKIGGLIGELD